MTWAARASVVPASTPAVQERVRAFVGEGLKPLDAAHLAFAEASACRVLLTCDDRFLRRSQTLDLSVRVLNPVQYVSETTDVGTDD